MFFHRSKWVIFAAILVTFFLIVLGRVAYFQLWRGKEYAHFADAYTVKEIPIVAPRGAIYDRRGKLLATTRPSFNLFVNLQKVRELSVLFNELAPLLNTTPERLHEVIRQSKDLPRFRAILLAEDLSRDQVAKIEMQKAWTEFPDEKNNDFAALEIRVEPVRSYSEGEIFAPVLGYLREVSEERLKQLQKSYPDRYRAGDQVGAQGLERRFDLELRGVNGQQELIVDALGREVSTDHFGLSKELLFVPPVPGQNLHLTLESGLQQAAFEALGDRVGAVVAMNPQNGEILALVSRPSYDPEQWVSHVSKSYWVSINQDKRKVLLNRVIQAAYPPGSTFKIVTGIAALAEGVIEPHEKISCPGYVLFGGRRFGCWLSRGHGPVDFYHALVQSCDVYFYRLGERLGVDRIAYYAKILGLGKTTGIELDFERSGLIPTVEWKEKTRKEPWNPSETLSVAIGQGYDLVTPLQNLLMIAQVANGGKKISPHLLKAMESPEGKQKEVTVPPLEKLNIHLEEGGWKELLRGLGGVVQDPSGTAHRMRLEGISMGGKTGTAQVVSYDKFGRKASSKKTQDHAWFVAFAPLEKPEIAVSVLVEHGGHGGAAAAPIAREVIKKYFEVYYSREKS